MFYEQESFKGRLAESARMKIAKHRQLLQQLLYRLCQHQTQLALLFMRQRVHTRNEAQSLYSEIPRII